MLADLVQRLSAREALEPVGLDHQQRVSLRAGLRVGARDEADQVRVQAVRDERLGAVDDVVVAVEHGRGRDAAQVRAGTRLRHRDRAHELAAHERRHPRLALGVVAVLQHVVRRDLVHALAEAREPRVQQLLVDHALEAEVAAQPTVLGRHVGAEQPGLPRAAPELGVDVAPLLPALVVREDLALDPGPRGLTEELVLVARPGRAGTRPGESRSCADHRTRRGERPSGTRGECHLARRVVPAMAIRSPHPDVLVPDVTLPDFVLGGAAARGERVAIVDAVSGVVAHVRRGCRERRPLRGRSRRAWSAARRARRHLRAQRARVRRRVPRRRARRRDEHDRQRALHGRGGGIPAAHRGCSLSRDVPPPRRARARGGRAPRASRRCSRSATRTGRRRSRSCSRPRAHRRREIEIDPATPARRAAVLERHDGPAQGRHADAPQPRREPLPVRARADDRRGRPRSSPSCRSSTSTGRRSCSTTACGAARRS